MSVVGVQRDKTRVLWGVQKEGRDEVVRGRSGGSTEGWLGWESGKVQVG